MGMCQSTIHPYRSKYSNTLYLCSTWPQGPHSADTQHYSLITFRKPLQPLGDRCANPAITACFQCRNRMVLGKPATSLNFKCNATWWIKGKEAWAAIRKGFVCRTPFSVNLGSRIECSWLVVLKKKMTRHYRLLLRNKVRDQLSRERLSEFLVQSNHHVFPVCQWLITTQ